MNISIANSILKFVSGFLDNILGVVLKILPNNSVLENVFNVDASILDRALSQLGNQIASFNNFFPIDTLLSCLSMMLFVEFGIFIFVLAYRLLHLGILLLK